VRTHRDRAFAAGYLFPEIGRRRNAYLEANPDAQPIISLGIGDTTMPVPPHILKGLTEGASKLGTKEGYSGYGAEQGQAALRAKISENLYGGKLEPSEVFVSDGSKCDIGRLQMMFGAGTTTAVQDPSYPVYVDTSVIMGQTGDMDGAIKQYGGIVYMPCNPSNGFFPDLANTPRADVVYFCSPNNPTGAAATKEQLQQLVDWANENGSIIVYDAAYAPTAHTVPTSLR
jgi:LL-diaminopimelate aminotransferase